jgi:hypothetical protein
VTFSFLLALARRARALALSIGHHQRGTLPRPLIRGLGNRHPRSRNGYADGGRVCGFATYAN